MTLNATVEMGGFGISAIVALSGVSCVRWHVVLTHISNTERSFHYVNAIPTTETKTPLRNAICITYTQFPIQKRNLHYDGGSEAVYCRDLLHIHCGCLAIDHFYFYLWRSSSVLFLSCSVYDYCIMANR